MRLNDEFLAEIKRIAIEVLDERDAERAEHKAATKALKRTLLRQHREDERIPREANNHA